MHKSQALIHSIENLIAMEPSIFFRSESLILMFCISFCSFVMVPIAMCRVLRAVVMATPPLAGVLVLFLMYYKSGPPLLCYPRLLTHHRTEFISLSPAPTLGPLKTDAPLLLVWSWPEGRRFDLRDCERLYAVDNCQLSDNRMLYQQAAAVLLYHNAIDVSLADLPAAAQRPRCQSWIWFNANPPADTARIAGLEDLFNLTLGYKADADISARPAVTLRRRSDPYVAPPEKTWLLCWIVNSSSGWDERAASYQQKLARHIAIETFATSSDAVTGENYFHTIGACKFYLSFEASAPGDYITEVFSGPLSAGAVPIVLGPPRRSYERIAPATSFIHVDDFPDAATLASFLLGLDQDRSAYRKFFEWRRFHTISKHPTAERHKFAPAICQACRHVGLRREYRVVPDLYKWFFGM